MEKNTKKIKTALISVYHKDNLEDILKSLVDLSVSLISTGGTANFIEEKGYPVTRVEGLTGYPGILGGRVKTLHPAVFGGILGRRHVENDLDEMERYHIPEIDLVIVDLYPFEATLEQGGTHDEIIEKIDIGGISLIRAAAKNYKDVLIIPSKDSYAFLLHILKDKGGFASLHDRMEQAGRAFSISSHYDTAIWNYFSRGEGSELKISKNNFKAMRYGENPHQEGRFYGEFEKIFDQLHGKEISYNNLLDIEAAVRLIDDFEETTFAILKHNNACGIACRNDLTQAWKDALAGDPVSAFGGVLITNREVGEETAQEIDQIFFEVIVAPAYTREALDILIKKKNRIILRRKTASLPDIQFRSLLNGVLWQERDHKTESDEDLQVATEKAPSEDDLADLMFANILVKHTKSNAIVLARNRQLIGSGTGQTSRIDSMKQAIEKAREFKHEVAGAVMASDAFFPFKDSVQIAYEAGISSVIQPGGSIRDQESIDFCNEHGMSMVFTGIRHFKH